MRRLGTLARIRLPEPVTSASRRVAMWSSGSNGLTVLFAVGLVLRLWLSRGGGFPYDIGAFASWADRLATRGFGGFYFDADYYVGYPPGYMYVLVVLGRISRLLTDAAPSTFLVKLPGVLADLGLAWLAAVLAVRLTPSDANREMWRGPAAAAILLNPAVFFTSAVWGQMDSLLALLVVGGFLLLGTGKSGLWRETLGLMLLVLALATKPQAAFVVPAAAGLLAWRYLRPAFSDEDRRAALVAGLARFAGLGLVSAGAFFVLMAPFGLGIAGTVRFYLYGSNLYSITSAWAFNFWGSVGFWRPDSGAEGFRVLGVPALYVGLGALVSGTLAVLYLGWRRLRDGEDEGRVLVFGGAALTLVAFAALTRMHERYLFLALALLAPLIAYRRIRQAFVLLSALVFVNVWFPYVYYLEFASRPVVKLTPLFNLLYGTQQDSVQKILLSIATGIVCVVLAFRGWRWLQDSQAGLVPPPPAPVAPQPELPFQTDADSEPEAPPVRRRWQLEMHPVGRRGALLAVAAFAAVTLTRMIGLGTEPGMYFDEVYHARTGGEYLQGKEVYEWTHPPLAKQIIGVSIGRLSGFRRVDGAAPAPGLRHGVAASSDDGIIWVDEDGTVRRGRFTGECGVRPDRSTATTDVAPSLVVATPSGAFVAGGGPAGPSIAALDTSEQLWRVELPSQPRSLATAGGAAFVVVESGELVRVGPDGEAQTVAFGAAAAAGSQPDGVVWVSFPGDRRVVSYGADGTERVTVQVQGRPEALVVVSDTNRVLVSTDDADRIESIDTESSSRTDELPGKAGAFAVVKDSGLAWAVSESEVRVIEPRGMSVLGRVSLSQQAGSLVGDPVHRRLVAVGPDGTECVAGRPQFAWRVGSAVFGSAIAAFALLLAMRLFGSALAGALAATFVAVDGLAFTMARIAMNDSYVTAFMLAGWFCLLSALYHTGAREVNGRSPRWIALLWLGGAGVAMGGAIASKWVGLYALAAMGLLVLWDVATRRKDGIAGLAGPLPLSLAVGGTLLLVVPALVYVVSYIPYFSLGHSFGDLVGLQSGMFGYHANLTASHPYGSPWYAWPVGRKAVWMYLGTQDASRAEIWTIPNPVVLGGGFVGLALLAWHAWRRRAVALAIIPLAALAQFLPWTIVGRVTFLYHYLPEIPFLAIGLAWWIGVSRKGIPQRQRMLEIGAVVAAALLVFVLLLPILDGWHVSTSYLDMIKSRWLRWMF